jgi:hypothetical protein
MKKVSLISKRGGSRPGAGRPKGTNKKKLSVSIDKDLHKAAKKSWKGTFSGLVESLLTRYLGATPEHINVS